MTSPTSRRPVTASARRDGAADADSAETATPPSRPGAPRPRTGHRLPTGPRLGTAPRLATAPPRLRDHPGYGTPAPGYGTPPGYGAPSGYGSAQPAPPPANWRLVLPQSAKNLLILFIVLGVITDVGAQVARARPHERGDQRAQREHRRGQPVEQPANNAQHRDGGVDDLDERLHKIKNLACATTADAQAASYMSAFASQVQAIAMPSAATSAAAAKVVTDATKASADFTTSARTRPSPSTRPTWPARACRRTSTRSRRISTASSPHSTTPDRADARRPGHRLAGRCPGTRRVGPPSRQPASLPGDVVLRRRALALPPAQQRDPHQAEDHRGGRLKCASGRRTAATACRGPAAPPRANAAAGRRTAAPITTPDSTWLVTSMSSTVRGRRRPQHAARHSW